MSHPTCKMHIIQYIEYRQLFYSYSLKISTYTVLYCGWIKCRPGPNMARGPKLHMITSQLVIEALRLWSLQGWSIMEFKPSYWSSFICCGSFCNCCFIIRLNCNWNHVLFQFWKESQNPTARPLKGGSENCAERNETRKWETVYCHARNEAWYNVSWILYQMFRFWIFFDISCRFMLKYTFSFQVCQCVWF